MVLHLSHGRVLALDRPRIMGILNVTPDSFSDGGRYVDGERAVAHGLDMAGEGADIIDVGGESTRPGSEPVSAAEQIRRTVEIIGRLRAGLEGLPQAPQGAGSDSGRRGAPCVSIDTSLVEVAAAALEAGASIINDVYAGRDPRNGSPLAMFELAAQSGAAMVLMHMQGDPATMQGQPSYKDVVGEVEAFLLERAAAAQAAGVDKGRIVLDPGIGFGKTKEHNLKLLAHLDRLAASGYPILLGASRKRFMGSILGTGNEQLGAESLALATCATTVLGVRAGVKIFRVHDVRANRQAADLAWAIESAKQ